MHRRTAALLAVGLFGVSACSGSDAGSAAPADTPADAAPTTDDAPATSAASDVDFCSAISAIQSAEFELEETFGSEARQLFSDVQASAPAEIADDVVIVINTLDAVAELGITTEETDPDAVDAAFEILLDPKFTEANERLEAYTAGACGIALDDGSDADLDIDDLEAVEF